MQRKLGQTTLMEAAGFTVNDQRLIYSTFLTLTLPHLYISRDQFNKFMASILGWPVNCLPHLFRSFNIRYRISTKQGTKVGLISLLLWFIIIEYLFLLHKYFKQSIYCVYGNLGAIWMFI